MMRNNATDSTLKRNYLQKYQFLVREYELVKAKAHPKYRLVKDFYAANGTCAQTFLKYYGRYRQSGDMESFLPGKRGPKWRSRRTCAEIEAEVLKARESGNNRYEIHLMLSGRLGGRAPSPSAVYQILKRHGMNRLRPKMKAEKRQIIRKKAGELAHIDCHHLSRDLIACAPQRRYLVCVVDSYCRVAWAEIVEDIQSLTVMFATLRCFNYLSKEYGIQFQEVLTDNGPEFGPKHSEKKSQHPFERMLMEMGIKHRHTQPYRPQTNGKVERFWRSLNEDLLEGTFFESFEQFEEELAAYLVYYNHARAHQGIGGKTPVSMLENLSTN